MAVVCSAEASTWEEIERSESYLVSCMFEEAASLASSIIRNLMRENLQNGNVENDSNENELHDMLESSGMVFVQSMKELARTLEILKELKHLFGSVTAIPVQVLVTGKAILENCVIVKPRFVLSVCFQISEGPSSDVEGYLKEFLSKWIYKDEGHYFSVEADGEEPDRQFSLGVDEYLEVVDLYVMTCLGMVLRDIDSAISWVEKASLPEDKRQELLRRLSSMNASKATSSSQAPASSLHANKHGVESKNFSKNLEPGHVASKENSVKETILKLSGREAPCFWWFRNITVKFGNFRLNLSNGNILLGCILLFTCYFLKRKQASLKRVLRKQALSAKKALVDLWQLAFSYQVNPLAAVQPLPAATRGSQ